MEFTRSDCWDCSCFGDLQISALLALLTDFLINKNYKKPFFWTKFPLLQVPTVRVKIKTESLTLKFQDIKLKLSYLLDLLRNQELEK